VYWPGFEGLDTSFKCTTNSPTTSPTKLNSQVPLARVSHVTPAMWTLETNASFIAGTAPVADMVAAFVAGQNVSIVKAGVEIAGAGGGVEIGLHSVLHNNATKQGYVSVVLRDAAGSGCWIAQSAPADAAELPSCQCPPGQLPYFEVDGCLPGYFGAEDRRMCRPCPKQGATCPGGNRIWATAGYWTPSETTEPVECFPRVACPGGDFAPSSCSLGYVGPVCSSCREGFFRYGPSSGGGTCEPCVGGAGTLEHATLWLTLLCFVSVLVFATARLPNRQLDRSGVGVGFVQSISQTLAQAGPSMPDALRGLAPYAALITLDIDSLRLACIGNSTYPFWAKLPGTLITALFALLSLTGASIAWGYRTTATATRYQAHPDSTRGKTVLYKRIKDRAVRAATIVMYLTYLPLTVAAFQLVHCRDGLLAADASVRCYEGAHLAVAWLAYAVLAAVTVGAPLALLYATQWAVPTGKLRRAGTRRLAFFTRDLRPGASWFRVLTFVQWGFVALNSIFLKSLSMKLLLIYFGYCAEFGLVLAISPFSQVTDTALSLVGGFIKGLSILVLMALDQATFSWPQMATVLAVQVSTALVAICYRNQFITALYRYGLRGILRHLGGNSDSDSDSDSDTESPTRYPPKKQEEVSIALAEHSTGERTRETRTTTKRSRADSLMDKPAALEADPILYQFSAKPRRKPMIELN
jgi:hypothetical protein